MSGLIIEDLHNEEQAPRSPEPHAQTEPVEHLAIAQHFNIDIPTKEENKKLMVIWDYAKTLSQVGDMQDTIWQVLHLSRSLGAPRLGESPLDKVYRWARLKGQEAQIQEELRAA